MLPVLLMHLQFCNEAIFKPEYWLFSPLCTMCLADERDLPAPRKMAWVHLATSPRRNFHTCYVAQHQRSGPGICVRGYRPSQKPIRLEWGVRSLPILHPRFRCGIHYLVMQSTSIYVLIRNQIALTIMEYFLPSFGSTAWFVAYRPQGMFPKCFSL